MENLTKQFWMKSETLFFLEIKMAENNLVEQLQRISDKSRDMNKKMCDIQANIDRSNDLNDHLNRLYHIIFV